MAEEGFKRKLAAILSADVKGYSRLMGDDEEATVRTLTDYREVFTTLIQQHNGKVVDSPGDNLLAEFASVVDAVQCAVAVQKEIKELNEELPENRRMDFRIGINLGDVIQKDEQIYGDGVNIAARIESLAEPGKVSISQFVYNHAHKKLNFGYEYQGEHQVKNIVEPVGVYKVLTATKYAGQLIGKIDAPKSPSKKPHIAIFAFLALAVATATWYFYPRASEITPASLDKMEFPLPDKPSIAVLPFENMSDDPKQEYLCDGLTEDIITALSKIRNMFVIARNSTFTYKGKAVKIQQVAEELGVRYVLEGSVQKSQDRLRINAQLIDAVKGYHLWAERYDRNLREIFSLQDEVTKKILTALQVEITEGEDARLWGKGANNLEAYLKLLQARQLNKKHTKEDNSRAQQLINKAIELDPQYAMAYSYLGATYVIEHMMGWSKIPEQTQERAMEMAQKAIALDDTIAEAYSLLGRIYLGKGQYEKAIAEGERAYALDPNSTHVLAALAYSLQYSGKPQEAIDYYKKAIRLDPIPPSCYKFGIGRAYRDAGRYEEAIATFQDLLSRSPKSLWAYICLTSTLILANREEEARTLATEALNIDPKLSVEYYIKPLPYKDKAYKESLIAALNKAGLPIYPPLPLPDKPSIAVLPFVNMSGDPDQEYLCDGIADQIINSIAKIPYITVIARSSSFAYKGKSVNVQQLASDLGVRFILEGSLQRDNENVRINTQLIDAKTGGHLWSENYDHKLDDIFSVQDEICKNIMVALQIKLTEGEMVRMYADTVNFKAFEKYIKALEHYYRRTSETSIVSRQLLQEAIDLDPEYAAAYVLVGWTYLDDIWLGMTKTPSESIIRAEEMAQKAISIRGLNAGENGLLSGIYLLRKDLDKAIEYAEKAVKLAPNYANIHNIRGIALRNNGQYDEAISSFNKALQLDPVKNINRLNNLAWAYLYSKQYEKAISIWSETLDRNPDYLLAYMGLTAAYWLTGSEDKAQQAAQQVLRINPKFSLGYLEKRSAGKNKELKEQLFDAWRKAGLK